MSQKNQEKAKLIGDYVSALYEGSISRTEMEAIAQSMYNTLSDSAVLELKQKMEEMI